MTSRKEERRSPTKEELEELRHSRKVISCTADHPVGAQSTESLGTWASVDDSSLIPLTADGFRAGLGIDYISGDGEGELVFDIRGVPPALANASRRVLLAEVPTIAIESVWIANNTSVIPDEILAHRLGLVPLRVDPELFESRPSDPDAEPRDTDTLVFTLKVKCTEVKEPGETAPKRQHGAVYSGDLVWVPQGDQEASLAADPPRPVDDKILLAKLRPGQEIDAQCYAHKGIGKDHAKFSPVCTASYRLMPEVRLVRKVAGEDARKLVETCSPGVFEIEDGPEGIARVRDERRCTMCRNCIREELPFASAIRLGRIRDHFIFSIESTGIIPARKLFVDSLKVVSEKCDKLFSQL